MKTKLLSALAISAILLTSCNNDDNGDYAYDGQVRFSSGVSTTRVGGTNGDQWEGTENIGIYMVEHGAAAIMENAENIKYNTSSTGTAAMFTSTTPIFYPVDDTQKVDFIAYHPYNSSVIDYLYKINTTNQSTQSDIDLMQSIADNSGSGYDKTQKSDYVNLVFNHQLTKLIINTTPDDGLYQADLAKMTVTIKGLYTQADYHINTCAFGTPYNNTDPIVTATTTPGSLYEAIVVPQSFAGNVVTVEFALNNNKNEVFVYEVPATTFQSAEKHIFNVKVQRTKVQVRGTINAWRPVGAINGSAT